jgi:hypothetical protein
MVLWDPAAAEFAPGRNRAGRLLLAGPARAIAGYSLDPIHELAPTARRIRSSPCGHSWSRHDRRELCDTRARAEAPWRRTVACTCSAGDWAVLARSRISSTSRSTREALSPGSLAFIDWQPEAKSRLVAETFAVA